MNKIIKHSFFILIPLLIISCGYTKTEDDKHPDMPVYPLHTNPKITIKPLDIKIDTIYRFNNSLIAPAMLYDEFGAYSKYIVSLDNELNIIDSVPFYHYYYISNDNHFYIPNGNDALLKYSSLKSKPTKVTPHPFDITKFSEEIEKQLKETAAFNLTNFPDSLHYYIRLKLDSTVEYKTKEEFNKIVLDELMSIKSVGSYLLLNYKDKQYQMLGLSRSDYEKAFSTKKAGFAEKFITDYETDLKITDQAVTANGSSGGNHFVPGTFYPKGIQYYVLNINGDTTAFKLFSEYIRTRKITARKIPNTNTYILDTRIERYDYDPSPSYFVSVNK